jgi:drug/metabolite transporter (DMT)-like permease
MGILAALVSAVFSTSKDIISKKLAVRIDGATSTFASFAFALPFYLIVLAGLGLAGYDIVHFTAAFWWLVVGRALTVSFAEGMKMYAFAHGDISLVTLVFSMSPLFLLVLSPLITGDELSVTGTVAVLVVVGGSLALVWRPSQGSERQKLAIVLALGASMFFAMNSVFDRMAVRPTGDEAPDPAVAVVAAFTMTLLSAFLLSPFVLLHRQRWGGLFTYRRGLLVRGFLEVAFMVGKLLAMQHLAAPYVVGLQRSSLILSVIAGRVLFRETDFLRRLLAALLILGGVLWIAWEQAGTR